MKSMEEQDDVIGYGVGVKIKSGNTYTILLR